MIPHFLAVGVIAFSTMACSAETLEAQEFTSAKALDCQDPANYGQSLAHLKSVANETEASLVFLLLKRKVPQAT